jgi:hypothetical protein
MSVIIGLVDICMLCGEFMQYDGVCECELIEEF